MKLNGNKKIVLLGLILLIIAGVIVVSLKGFNVGIEYEKHERIDLKVGNGLNVKDIDNICKEVLGEKSFKVKNLEVFGDSVSIISENFTDDEETSILNKVNEKYGTKFVIEKADENAENTSVDENAAEPASETVEENTTEPASEVVEGNDEKEVAVKSIPKLRIRDMVSPYIKGTVIASILIIVYLIIMLKVSSKSILKGVLKYFCDICIVELALAALIAICRVPMSPTVVNVLFIVALLITIKFIKNIDKLKDGKVEKE